MSPAPQSNVTLYGRSCTVCSHQHVGDIDAGLVAHLPIAQLARQFEVSRDSIYRHLKWHLRPALQEVLTSTPETRPVALVERLAEIANDARAARATAYAAGNAQLGARLGEAERRALDSLADRFHINHDSVTADRTKVSQLARALDTALDESPELASLVADALEAEGLGEMAEDMRADLPSNPETKGLPS
ncbi:hypothetical protein ACFUPZ_07505 [Microbacterium oxydans]|jgi:hypothetical protein|uniref:hypothetical protein n=1 Tax=Microbacterium oxydans TaxID=82380 RepID=UPI003630052A